MGVPRDFSAFALFVNSNVSNFVHTADSSTFNFANLSISDGHGHFMSWTSFMVMMYVHLINFKTFYFHSLRETGKVKGSQKLNLNHKDP